MLGWEITVPTTGSFEKKTCLKHFCGYKEQLIFNSTIK